MSAWERPGALTPPPSRRGPGACTGSRAPPCGTARSAGPRPAPGAVARARQVDAQDLADGGGRAVGHHHDAVGQQHRFVDIVRHHHHGGPGARDDGDQLVLQLGPRQRVERAEGLVHQQHLRLHRQRAGDAHALLHAAGDLVPASCPRRASGPPAPAPPAQRSRSCALLSRVAEHALHRQVHVVEAAQPGQQRVVLEHHAAVRARGPRSSRSSSSSTPLVGVVRPGHQVEQRATCRSPSGRSA